MRKIIVYCYIVVLLYCCFASPIWAAKKRPPRGGGASSQSAPVKRVSSPTRGIKSSVRFRSDRRALILSFSSFNSNISSVTYALTYVSNGVSQGAQSTLAAQPAGGDSQRELLFGTCSGGICSYHKNITNARLVIDTKLKSGITIRKPYRIKI